MPKKNDFPYDIVVEVKGGVVTAVYARDASLRVYAADLDVTDGDEQEEMIQVIEDAEKAGLKEVLFL